VSISGGPDRVHAPAIGPGQYLDSYPTSGENPLDALAGKYYRFILNPGDTPYFSATQVLPAHPPAPGTDVELSVTMETVDPNGIGCSFSSIARATAGTPNAVTAVLAPGQVGGPGWPQRCPTDAAYAVQVVRAGTAYPAVSLATEIALRVEPRALPTGGSAPAAPQPNITPLLHGAAHTVTGGTGFDDAPFLHPGTYRDRFTSGETRYFRVSLSWGQRLAWAVTVDEDHVASDFPGVSGHVVLFNPLRQSVAQPATAHASSGYLGSVGSVLGGSTLVPVRYANRGSTQPAVIPYSVDGDYYLAVVTNYPGLGHRAVTDSYSLTVDIVGAPQPGPAYAAPTVTPPAGPTQRAAVLTTPAAAIGATQSHLQVVVIAGAVAFLLAAGLMLVFLRRRRANADVLVAHTAPLSTNRMRADRWLGR
jgi:hypothetical protein